MVMNNHIKPTAFENLYDYIMISLLFLWYWTQDILEVNDDNNSGLPLSYFGNVREASSGVSYIHYCL